LANDERGREQREDACNSEECGFTIFIDGRQIFSFMESGDYSSARELEHFNEVGSQLEKRVREGVGLSVLALTAQDNRLSRDFAVLQIAHVLAKRGKRVLIVDCDFLRPGLNGLVENIEGLGFLDLLLYGSSLQSVAHTIGVDGVLVIGPGSFPVYKTMPFAKREFGKINEFLVKKNDIVIYCSTLYTDEGEANSMMEFVENVLYCCRIEDMDEGQLKKNLEELSGRDFMVDVVCFSSKEVKTGGSEEEPAVQATPPERDRDYEPVYIEKMGEIETEEREKKRRFNLPRFITIVAAVIVVSFIVYWVVMNRMIREQESSSRMTELVQKQRDAREALEKRTSEGTAADTTAVGVGEADGGEPAAEKEADVAAIPVETAPKPEPPRSEIPSGPRYAVHVSSFTEKWRADAEVSYLEKQGYETQIVDIEKKGIVWFRVLVGEFANREDAGKAAQELLALRRITYAQVVKIEE
jgi:cell division septation protein DedD